MAKHEASPRTPSAPLHWRVRACRWLWRGLGFVWGTFIGGIAIGIAVNLATATTYTPLAKLYIVHLAQTYPLPVWSGLGLLSALTLLAWLGSRGEQVTSTPPLSEQDRSHMLRRLRARYEQVLAQSLQGVVQLELGLASRPGAVQNAVSLALRMPDQPDHPLPPHTSIIQAYELAQQELLILGEPGAGKSTLLLGLAQHLVEQADHEGTQLLPILLPLSSWAVTCHRLEEWLSEEIARLYEVSPRLSQQWIQAEQVLPLLDGLDEMDEAARPACIAAINTYHREHLRPLVVCSRTSEYHAATRQAQLELGAAVVVQPLEPEHVDAYLTSLGKPLDGLRAALQTNTLLQELATTPLLLQVLMLTYHDMPVRTLPQQEAKLREQIWTDYVQRMVLSKGNTGRYPFAITIDPLRWLASEMRQHNQTIFSLESLQPDSLSLRQRKRYRWSVGLAIEMIFGLLFGLAGGLVGGLAAWLYGEPISGLVNGLFIGLVIGLAIGIGFGIGFGNASVKPAEILTWSWKNFRAGLFRGGLLVGLPVGLLFFAIGGLYGVSTAGLIVGLATGLAIGLIFGLPGWLAIGLILGLLRGFSREQLTERLMLAPNEGIHRSLKNGLVEGLRAGLTFGLLGGLIFGIVAGLVGGVVDGLLGGLIFGLATSLIFGLIFGLISGFAAAFQHYALRFWLARSGVFPWQAVPFLEDATARILLRRVGGGYSFAHRLLLDYFADLDAQTPLAQEAAQTKSTSVQTKTSTSADKS